MEITPTYIENLILTHLTTNGEHIDELCVKLGLHIDYYASYIVILRDMTNRKQLSRCKPPTGCNCSGDTLIKKYVP